MGCTENPLYSDLEHHVEFCQSRLVKCKYSECSKILPQVDLELHQDLCLYKPVTCKLCNNSVISMNLNTHLKSECAQALVCPQCGQAAANDATFETHN